MFSNRDFYNFLDDRVEVVILPEIEGNATDVRKMLDRNRTAVQNLHLAREIARKAMLEYNRFYEARRNVIKSIAGDAA